MKFAAAVFAAAFAGSAYANELTKETWDAAVEGKTVFVKFLAPWWGHCKRMKPAWDKLMSKYEGHKDILVADVDCTAGGKSLCEEVGVRGYPTIKHGDPSDLQDYEGGREEKDLKKFAKSLGPTCSPKNIDLCDADKKAMIEKFQKMTADERDAQIKEDGKKLEEIEATFKSEVEKLQNTYESLNKKKDEDLKAVKDSGLGLLKAVHNAEKKAAGKAEL